MVTGVSLSNFYQVQCSQHNILEAHGELTHTLVLVRNGLWMRECKQKFDPIFVLLD
jgi:hypothetical protein